MVYLTRLGGKMSPYNYPFMRLIMYRRNSFSKLGLTNAGASAMASLIH